MHTHSLRPHLQLLGMALLWGANWSWGRAVVQSMPPLTAATLRFILAAILLVGWLLLKEGTRPLLRLTLRQWAGLAAAAAFGVCSYAVFFMQALQYVPAGKAATVVALNPIPTLLLADSQDPADQPLKDLLAGDLSDDAALVEALTALRSHPVIERSRAQVRHHASLARQHLGPLPDGEAKQLLLQVCDDLVERSA